MKTAIYTIAKNEAHNVAAFMKAAEGVPVYILDTGSTDDTVALLKEHGANVEQQVITPWRFDTARNIALEMVPNSTDICVSLDMDEVIQPGWQKILNDEWQDSYNMGDYMYIPDWSDENNTIPKVTAPRTRIHTRKGFEWQRKIHEIIAPLPTTKVNHFVTSIWVHHYQDKKQRNYSEALTDLLNENPYDLDSRLQRAAEMLDKEKWNEAIEDYSFYIKAAFDDQRPIIRHRKCICWLALAQCYHALKNYDMCYRCFLYSVGEDPNYREGWCSIANIAAQIGNAPLAYGAAMTAHNIKNVPPFYAKDVQAWGDIPKKIADSMFGKLMEGK